MLRTGELLEAALEALPVPAIVAGAGGALDFVNARARELLGLEAGDRAPEVLEPVLRRARARGGTVREAVDVVTGRAHPVVVEVWAAAFPGGVVCTLDDLSRRVRRERADREFITNAAHQLRTPITAIATAIEVLQSGAKLEEESRDRFLDHIELQTRRLVRLSRAMLALSRAERGDDVPPRGPVELKPLLDQIVQEVEGSSVPIENTCAPGVHVLADAALLTEALANLVHNAVEHTRVGNVRIGAAVADGVVTIEIADTGVGIPSVELDRVLERFHRGEHDREGAGLGLSIANATMKALDGSLELESREGVGTTV